MLFDNSKVEEKGSIVPAVRIEDCRLVKIETAVTKTGEKSIDFTFQQMVESGGKKIPGPTVKDKIFEPVDRTANPPYADYSFEAEFNKIVGRIKHIQGRYMSPDEVNATKGEDWDSYCKAVINSFPAGYKDVPCALSVVYLYNKKEGKDFVGLRKFPPFVSTEKYPKEFPEKTYSGESWKGTATTATSNPVGGTPSAPVSEEEI